MQVQNNPDFKTVRVLWLSEIAEGCELKFSEAVSVSETWLKVSCEYPPYTSSN